MRTRVPLFAAAFLAAASAGYLWWVNTESARLKPTAGLNSAPDDSGTLQASDSVHVAAQNSPGAPLKPRNLTKDAYTRAKELRYQTEKLSSDQADELCRFLETVPNVDGVWVADVAALKNAIMNRLGAEASPGRFCEALLKIQGDDRQPEVMRDYAVQHLSAWYDKFPDEAKVRKALWERSGDPKGTTAPTALLALRRLDKDAKLTPSDHERLKLVSQSIVGRDSAPDAARMTALDILRTGNEPSALEAARALVREKHSTALTVAAIGTLGALGNAEDAEWLNQSPLKDQRGLARTIDHALENLKDHTEL